MKYILLGIAALSVTIAAADAKGKHSYAQGACDGIRATDKYPASAKIAVVIVKASGKSDYLACNGDIQADTVADVTLFVHQKPEPKE